ncbi:MAG: hypothetical protein MJ016_01225 [Victivallaceae bacterium]|nr:hypothetical protein [Victivallaceae bacterium]
MDFLHIVFPLSVTEVPVGENELVIQSAGEWCIACFNQYGDLRFNRDNLSRIVTNLPQPQPGKELLLTGSLPNFAAAAAAIHAQKIGWRTVSYWSPRMSSIFQLYPDLKEIPLPSTMHCDGKIIAVVGDPNSGKSVFFGLLEAAGRRNRQKIWMFDCDYAAPTPKWYLQMMRNGLENAGKELRLKYKRTWTKEGENEMRNHLCTLKHAYPMIIADFPGGIHQSDKPPVRIPPHREVMLEPIDYFIIISRKDRNCEAAWKEELAKFGLQDKILCTFWSADNTAPLRLWNDQNRWCLDGLDRKNEYTPEVCDHLWQVVTGMLRARERK